MKHVSKATEPKRKRDKAGSRFVEDGKGVRDVESIDDLTEEERKERARRFVFTAEDVEVVEEEEDAGN